MKISTRSLRYKWHRLIGTKKIHVNDVYVSTALEDITPNIQRALFRGTYEDTERDFTKQFLKPNSKVLEIGCGIGLISLVARKICIQGSVKSYEANPHMEPLIRKNYALNGLEPDLEMKAVTVDGSDVAFFIDPEVISSSLFDRQKKHEKSIIKSDALDDILNSYKPDTIIMDVEGAEIDLLPSSSLNGISLMIVELHPHIVDEDKIAQLNETLKSLGFNISAKKGKVAVYTRTV